VGTVVLLPAWLETPDTIPEFEELPTALASRIAVHFCLPAPLEVEDFLEKGNINQHTYLVTAGIESRQHRYLLQQINQRVFRRPDRVMAAMLACIQAQRDTLAKLEVGSRPGWETIELIPVRQGAQFLELRDLRGTSWWRLMRMIEGCRSFKSLSETGDQADKLALAREAGRGLALFGDLTACMRTAGLLNPLPGYRDTRLYFSQLDCVLGGASRVEEAGSRLPRDEDLRESTKSLFFTHLPKSEYRRRLAMPEVGWAVELAGSFRTLGLTLQEAMESGRIRTVAIHGDTKLDNFLFDRVNGKVRSLVDLDTIMPHTWLADWGDMVRSLSNVAGEKERDPRQVRVDLQVYRALAEGFLGTARTILPNEIRLMVPAVQVITLELGLRFLADYLRGDNYFRLSLTDPPDLNKVRAISQFTLFEQLRDSDREAREFVRELAGDSWAGGEDA
jgi:hypothetical protein